MSPQKHRRIATTIPDRLDRLPWSRWHWRVVIALGVIWILDGLEVTIVGSVASVLNEPTTLGLTETQIGASASAYLAGAVTGALFFGRLSDRFGRKKLFLVTLALYVVATTLTALSWSFISFAVFRALTGAGIGGESSAVNSAIDELLPARVRGRTAIILNGTYWLGTALGAAASVILLNPRFLPHQIGWRVAFGMGAVLGIMIVFVRRHIAESPRWLLLHGRVEEAEHTLRKIEQVVAAESGFSPSGPAIVRTIEVKGTVSFSAIAYELFHRYRRRALLCLSLMISQAFTYNAIFFTYALVLRKFYNVVPQRIGLYILPFAISNWIGPLALAQLFDRKGRKIMLAITYALAGVLLAGTGYGFAMNWLTSYSLLLCWCLVFFFASAAASASYLTVSEVFPVEMRGLAIALFYAIGTAIGGVGAPALFGALIQSGSRTHVAFGYVCGAVLMLGTALCALVLGVPAERKSLEEIAEMPDVGPAKDVNEQKTVGPAAQ